LTIGSLNQQRFKMTLVCPALVARSMQQPSSHRSESEPLSAPSSSAAGGAAQPLDFEDKGRIIIHDGYQYKTLADHDPHSTQKVDESGEYRALDPEWEICPNTPDTVRVCAAFPWQVDVLVFDDGSAVGTFSAVEIGGGEGEEVPPSTESLVTNGMLAIFRDPPGQIRCKFGALRRDARGFFRPYPIWYRERCNSVNDPNPYPHIFSILGGKCSPPPGPFVYPPTTFKRLPPPTPSLLPQPPTCSSAASFDHLSI